MVEGETTTTKASTQQQPQDSTTRTRTRRSRLEAKAGVIIFVPLLFPDAGSGVCLGDDAVAAAAAMMM